MYADPTPNINVKIKTPTKSDNELKMYSYKKVFFSISKYSDALDLSSSSAVSVISKPKSPGLRSFSYTKSKIKLQKFSCITV